MTRRIALRTTLSVTFLALIAHAGETPEESPHIAGPQQLSGWTLNYDVEGQGKLPQTLVISRSGHVVRRISGDPFVWNWMFTQDGKQVAYESGPLHFSMSCVLVNIATGKQVGYFDCFHELPVGAPAWVKTLERVAVR